MKKMLLLCAMLMLVSALAFAQTAATPAPTKAPDAKATMTPDMAMKTVTGMLTVDVAKKEASIKVGEKTTKLEWNKTVEDTKLAGKTVEAKGTMKADVLTATEIKEATAAPKPADTKAEPTKAPMATPAATKADEKK